MLSSPLAAPRLVGRDDEIAFLLRLLEDALGHAPGSVTLIDGVAGIGKTRLLAELRRRAADFGALTITVQAFEQVRDPYAPLVIAVARAIDQAAGRIAEHLRSVGSALDADAKLTKAKRLALVATAFRGILRERPVGLFFEDLHWADRATTDLLVFLSTELAVERFFVALTMRPDGMPADLAGKFRGAVHTVRLGPLDSRHITTIVREALRGRGSLGADHMRRITELAGGNPLFALELLRNALAGGGDAGSPALAYPILQRLARLDAQARLVIELASAVGSIEPGFLALLQASTPTVIEDFLERAQRYALVVCDPVSGDWRFAHALTRAAIEAQITPRRRIQMHRAIGELLEREERAVDVARLAYHWRFAGDEQRTLRYNEAAADRAAELHDYAAAMRFLEAAIGSAPPDRTVVARLNEKLADAAMIEGSPSRARDQIDVALQAYATLGDRAGLTRMHLHRSRLRWFDGDPAEALAEALRALEATVPLGPSGEQFHVHVRLAQLHQLAGRHIDVRRELDAAQALLGYGSPKEAIPFYNTRAMLRADDWDLTGFVADYRTAIGLAEQIGHIELRVSTQNNLALNAFLTGQPQIALPAVEASIATSYELGMRWHVSNHLLSLARIRYGFGDVAGARAALQDALSSGYEARRLDLWIAATGIPIAIAAADRSLLARCTTDGVVEQALATGDAFCISSTICAQAELLIDLGRASEIGELLGRALDALRVDARPLFIGPYFARFGRESDFARARGLLSAPERDRSRSAERALFDAYVATRKRRRAEALERALEAAAGYTELHWVFEQARALEVAGRNADALRIYRQAGSLNDVARLELAGRAVDPLASLTPREREVVELVLGGCSNREAALKLRLSDRTVGNHLQSVFNRLGVGSRRELAQYVAEASE
jgi:DNA-binding CsgD family transcriptional regulator